MKHLVIGFISVLGVQFYLAAAQTTCLGINCESDIDRYQPDGPQNDGYHSQFDQFILDAIRNGWMNDPAKQQCIQNCHREFQENVIACADALEGDMSIFVGVTADACFTAAKRRLHECLPSPGAMNCF